ncbi:TraR/DksA family transcriptional regulator [Blattabacterium cuenoti]|uniref:TraR/DksA family transcriptional regulator n=1 Tax=Blattabacterium cuenoti TaxID=1653831 RepID=UPI00163CBC62|nr:TraR/DksA C4-type zinc finger protein [Blattabacterium cuenoti]
MKVKGKQRYSMEERKEFRKLILEKLKKAKKDLSILKNSFSNSQNNGTDDTYPTFKAFEEGSETLSKEQNAQILEHLQRFINSLNSALIRVENEDYGICRITNKLIPKARLMAVPHTTLSIEGKMLVEKNN